MAVKKKIYVITLSRTFPATHKRKGQETHFVEKAGVSKIHTIRNNPKHWQKKIEAINAGKAVLSLRYWTGKPYQTKQVEFAVLEKVGMQLARFNFEKRMVAIKNMDESFIGFEPLSIIANNDGLTTEDFQEWFNSDESTTKIIIHFTDLRYGIE